MLRIENLNAWWGGAQVLFDVSLAVAPGELVVLQGLNGAGKSSLLQAIMGLGPHTTGRIDYAQGEGRGEAQMDAQMDAQGTERLHSLRGLAPYQRAQRGLGYVPEDRRLFTELTVQENLWIAVPARSAPSARLAQVLALFPALGGMLQRPAGQMSGGEQQMLALARTLMSGPRLLLLDEPCEGIAPVLVQTLRNALLQLAAQGVTMLVAEQNPILADHAQRVLTLVGGRMGAAQAVP